MSLFWEDRWAPGATNLMTGPTTSESLNVRSDPDPLPAMYLLGCLQCRHTITVIVHNGPSGLELVALPSTYGGLSTPHTPPAVAYYLDQAQRAQSVGALSGAIAMYRSALEHLLFEQGFQQRMLGPKIAALEAAQPPPRWRSDLDDDYLTVINRLGNWAIHPNDGEISKQTVFDADLLREVQALFSELLDLVYERPQQRTGRLARLRAALAGAEMKSPSAGAPGVSGKPETTVDEASSA